jgi:diguanylate cyclase (GGDEF)-like protein
VQDITARRHAELALEQSATHDPLTGLPNRLVFERRLRETIAAAGRDGRHDYALLFLDLDSFKVVNDSLGHAAWRPPAARDRRAAAAGARPDALVARHGGDEFTVLPAGECNVSRAVSLAQRVLRAFAEPFRWRASRCSRAPASASCWAARSTRTRTTCCATRTPPCTGPRRRASRDS